MSLHYMYRISNSDFQESDNNAQPVAFPNNLRKDTVSRLMKQIFITWETRHTEKRSRRNGDFKMYSTTKCLQSLIADCLTLG